MKSAQSQRFARTTSVQFRRNVPKTSEELRKTRSTVIHTQSKEKSPQRMRSSDEKAKKSIFFEPQVKVE